MANPVIGTMKCPESDCDEIVSVHQVAKGRGRRFMFYTNCPGCGCDQRLGKKRQEKIFNNASARRGYESVFEGQQPPAFEQENRTENGQLADDEIDNENNDLTGQDDQEKGSKSGLVVLGLIVTGILAVVGLKK